MSAPNPIAAPHAGAILINLTMPVTRIGFGPFTFDPLEELMGGKLAHILEPLLAGPVTRQPSEAGPAVEVYPLALPDGEGASIPLGQWGEVGFRNDNGLLVLTVPWGMASWLQKKHGDAIVSGPQPGLSIDSTARVAEAWVRLRPGMKASIPLGAWGECAVEGGLDRGPNSPMVWTLPSR